MTKHYLAYLLRLWQADDLDSPAWRASLEDPSTRQVTGFSSVEALYEYLVNLNSSRASAPPAETAASKTPNHHTNNKEKHQ